MGSPKSEETPGLGADPLLSADEVAEAFGRTVRAVNIWASKNGAPHHSDGGQRWFRLSELKPWLIKTKRMNPDGSWRGKGGRKRKSSSAASPAAVEAPARAAPPAAQASGAQARAREEGPVTSINEANRRKAVALAELRELELSVKRGLYVKAADVKAARMKMISAFKAGMFSLPAKVSQRCVGLDEREMYAEVEALVRDVLTHLAEE